MSDFLDLSDPEWEEFFPDVCAISQPGEPTTNDLGEIVTLPVPLVGFDAVQCQVIHQEAKIDRATGEVVQVERIEIGLRGYFPDIVAGMWATVGWTRYSILYPISDSQHVKTRLVVEVTR